jgi:hypothetical protein
MLLGKKKFKLQNDESDKEEKSSVNNYIERVKKN